MKFKESGGRQGNLEELGKRKWRLFNRCFFIKRNADAFSLNAVVDVRLRRRRRRRRHRHEFFFNISEIARASNFKIYHHVDHDNLYIYTGNDVINYFWSAENRTHA